MATIGNGVDEGIITTVAVDVILRDVRIGQEKKMKFAAMLLYERRVHFFNWETTYVSTVL